MPTFTDQTGHVIRLDKIPSRVISLVPSQTEFLWDIGLRQELVGITKFCIHPEVMYKTVQRVGGTKQLDFEKIRALQPDLIIGNREENEKEQIVALRKEFPVWMSDIYQLSDSLEMMRITGTMTGKAREAAIKAQEISDAVNSQKNKLQPKSVAYFIWRNPWMLAAGSTFIDHILSHLGLINCAGSLTRYPAVDEQTITELRPELVFLSSEPYPFREKHIAELQALLPESKIMLVDGEVFSWYGTRLLKLPEYIRRLRNELD